MNGHILLLRSVIITIDYYYNSPPKTTKPRTSAILDPCTRIISPAEACIGPEVLAEALGVPLAITTPALPPDRVIVFPCNAGFVAVAEGIEILVEAVRMTFVVPLITVVLPPEIGNAELTGIVVGPRTTKLDPDATLTGPGRT